MKASVRGNLRDPQFEKAYEAFRKGPPGIVRRVAQNDSYPGEGGIGVHEPLPTSIAEERNALIEACDAYGDFSGRGPLVQFVYTNWRGTTHVYLVDVERFEVGAFRRGGVYESTLRGNESVWVWAMHGRVLERDGAVRTDEDGKHPRRTFLLRGIRDLREVSRVD